MKIFIISGEASGDLHGSNLVKEMKLQNPTLELQGWGGDMMAEQGVEILKHYKELAFMGFVEVLANIRTISKNFKLCKQQINDFKPDAVIFIDYPGFNLRMAAFCKELNIPTLYYISPQIWAWKQNRIKKIKKVVDRMFVILPFEEAFYKQFDYKANFVGHPLIDAVEAFKLNAKSKVQFIQDHDLIEGKKIIALLPGSRKQEIKTKLPLMLSVIDQYPDYQFVIAGAPSQDKKYYEDFLNNDRVSLISGDTYNLLNNAEAGLITSGTATLETALFKVPQVVCYKSSAISYHIAKRIIKVKYISLVNLIEDKKVVTELIQGDLTKENLKIELTPLLVGEKREKMLNDYDALITHCGGVGASKKTAELILQHLN